MPCFHLSLPRPVRRLLFHRKDIWGEVIVEAKFITVDSLVGSKLAVNHRKVVSNRASTGRDGLWQLEHTWVAFPNRATAIAVDA